MKVKSLLSTFMAAVLALSLAMITPVQAAGTGVLSIATQQASVGGDVTVAVQMTENPGIVALAFNLTWDDSALTLKSVDKEGTVVNYGSDNSTEKIPSVDLSALSSYTFDCSNDTASTNYTATGKVVSLTFTVKDTHDGGAETVNFTITPTSILDFNMTQVPFTSTNGTINIIKPLVSAVSVSLTAPAMGATPAATVTGTGFDGTVTWSPDPSETDGKFAAATVYTATVTLAPTDVTFNPFAAPSTVTVNGGAPTAVTTNSASSIVLTKVFPATSSKNDVSDNITFATAALPYSGDAQPLPVATISGGDTSGSFTYTGDNRTQTDAGTYTTTAVYESATGYGTKEVTWSITPAALTITGATAIDRDYDGTTAVAITGAALSGVKTADTTDVSIAAITGTVDSADASGTPKAVDVAVSLAGARKDNYTITAPTGLTVTITPVMPTYTVPSAQNIKVGSALAVYEAIAPVSGTGISGAAVTGTVVWYSESTWTTPVEASDVSGLAVTDTKTLYWAFTPTNGNYAVVKGSTTFTVQEGDPQSMAFATASTITKTFGDAGLTNAASHTASADDAANGGIGTRGAISYTSGTPAVATVDPATGAVTIVGAGTTTITATAAAVSGKWMESTATYTLTVNKKALTLADITRDLASSVYTGSANSILAPTATGGGTVIVKYDNNATVPINAGTYAVSVEVAESANYNAATFSLGNYTITPAVIAVDTVTLAAKTYDGTTNAVVSAVTFTGGTPAAYTKSAVFAAAGAGAAQSFSATVTLTDTNYTFADSKRTATFDGTAAIAKATVAGVPQTLYVAQSDAKEYDFTLNKLLPSIAPPSTLGAVSYAVGTVTDSATILDGTPSEAAGLLTVPMDSTTSDVAATIQIIVASDNYANFIVTLTVQPTAKEPVSIEAIPFSRDYNGSAYYTPTVAVKDSSGDSVTGITLEESYAGVSAKGDVYGPSTTGPTNAGTYTLTLSVPAANANYIGTEVFPFSILPAPLTVQADNKTIIQGAALPAYTITQTPAALLGTDDWTTQPTATSTATTPTTIGSYPITVTPGAMAADVAQNYAITYTDGMLNVIANNDATLSSLTLAGATLAPAFSSSVQNYTASVANAVSSVTVTAIAASVSATVSGTGTATLAVGANIINVVVTAPDGVTTATYVIVVTRAAGTDNNTGGSQGGYYPLPGSSSGSSSTATQNQFGGTTVNTPSGQLAPTQNANGSITLRGNGTIKTGNATTINATAGTTVQANGTVILGSTGGTINTPDGTSIQAAGNTRIQPNGAITLGGNSVIQTKDNMKITVPSGSAVNTSGSVTIGSGGATVLRANGETDTIPEGIELFLDEDIPLGFVVIGLPHSDVPRNAWYFNSVAYAYLNGLMSGTSAGSPPRFSPNASLTRGMLVTIIHNHAGKPSAWTNVFSDVPNGTWYTDATAWAHALGIVNGVGNGNFAPNAAITRQDMAVIILRYAELMGYELPVTRDGAAFADASDISSYAADAVSALYRASVINGKPSNLFDPNGTATRAEVATVLMNFLESVGK